MEGFTKKGLRLLGALPGYDKDRFATEKADYQRLLADPTKAFVDDLGPRLASAISPGIQWAAKTNGSISPINNDLRFTPDAAPYKDHLLLRFWEGPTKRTAPTLWVRIGAKDVGFASGVAPADVGVWRKVVDGDAGGGIASALEELTEATGADVVGADLKRVPAPYPADHPRADLLRHKWLQVRWLADVDPTSETFVEACADELAKAGDLHRRLVGSFT
jgi:uncharacterized protein (DUF2461 family)